VPVISVVKDVQARSLTVAARFDATIGRVWQLWSDPRQLERWWGPPSYPATVLEHDPAPGGTISYVMTGPNGERHGGWFGVRAADPPHMLELDAGFADADGNPIPDGPWCRPRFWNPLTGHTPRWRRATPWTSSPGSGRSPRRRCARTAPSR